MEEGALEGEVEVVEEEEGVGVGVVAGEGGLKLGE